MVIHSPDRRISISSSLSSRPYSEFQQVSVEASSYSTGSIWIDAAEFPARDYRKSSQPEPEQDDIIEKPKPKVKKEKTDKQKEQFEKMRKAREAKIEENKKIKAQSDKKEKEELEKKLVEKAIKLKKKQIKKKQVIDELSSEEEVIIKKKERLHPAPKPIQSGTESQQYRLMQGQSPYH